MASHGKNYPDRSRDERRRAVPPPPRPPGSANEHTTVRQQAPTMSDTDAARYEELAAYDTMMRDVGGPVSQLADYLLNRDGK